MGYVKHHTIVVTSCCEVSIKKAQDKALKIFSKKVQGYDNGFNKLVSKIVKGVANYQHSFFIAPDGSKEGWEPSQLGDKLRGKFTKWLTKNGYDFVEVCFGGDDNYTEIIN